MFRRFFKYISNVLLNRRRSRGDYGSITKRNMGIWVRLSLLLIICLFGAGFASGFCF